MPPRPLTWHVDSSDDGLVLVTVSGDLGAEGGAALHGVVLRSLARAPVAILVVLWGMRGAGPGAAAVLATMIRQAEAWPGTPVLLCAPGPATASLITDATGVPLFATTADARAALTGRDELVSELVLPVPGAARHARNVATEACVRWDLPHLTAPVTLVASELVTNAIEHARTVMTLQIRLRPRLLYVAVTDGADAEPVRAAGPDAGEGEGRGLRLVELMSTCWGYRRLPGGKVVWASFVTTDPPPA